jgi:hypothetical protein
MYPHEFRDWLDVREKELRKMKGPFPSHPARIRVRPHGGNWGTPCETLVDFFSEANRGHPIDVEMEAGGSWMQVDLLTGLHALRMHERDRK